ncbi:cobalamin biosynthesis protein CobT [Modicisalibacter xianhensis]|uniref:Cobalamin biosynthesis protein CobT n=1 Tax=Modicisalibacter xianhensis TaxID=442341 RepID=A0A4V3GTK0_9GAMM|nr:VWA domain-containing protein [Halomonas xianhensis]TDX26783.1 cobalamin biosynthesis protein CobT [Halomonas xianhensis]
MSLQKRTIHNALPIVAAAYGRKFGVKVVIGNDMAYTDGKTIVVPNIPEDYPHQDALWGYVAHESAHVRLTDFSVHWDAGLHHRLTNIIEDARIEREMIAIYPGMAHTLNEVARYMAFAGHYEVPRDDSPAAFVLEGFCLYYLQCQVVGQQAISDLLERTRAVFERKFPKGVQVRLHALLRKIWNLKSTQDAADLARAIIAMIQEEAEKPQPPTQPQPQPDSSDDDDNAQGADNQGDQSSDDTDAGNDDTSGQGGGDDDNADSGNNGQDGSNGADQSSEDKAASQDADNDHYGTGAGGHASDDANDDDENSSSSAASAGQGSGDQQDDYQQVLQQVLSAGSGDHIGDAHQSLREELNRIANDKGDNTYRTVREAQRIEGSAAAGKSMQNEVRATTSRIRTQLMGLVQASQRTSHRTVRHGKRLDTARLARLASGDTRVFRQPSPRRRPNTAVHLLVDVSSSMAHGHSNGKLPFEIAREAALAIGLALEAINGVNPAVTFFGGYEQAPVFSAVRHGESVSRNVGRFTMRPTGTTPMAEAIWYSAFELVQTREERKLLVVVTDGDPNEAAPTHTVVQLCEASGVEVIGLGIACHAVSRFFSNHVVIDSVDDLKRTLFRLVERSLTADPVA